MGRISGFQYMKNIFLWMILFVNMLIPLSAAASPDTPSSPSISDGATGVALNPVISWTCANADSYEVYFGTSSNPPYVSTTTSASYVPSGLTPYTTYYWRVVAKNNDGNTSGPVWSFTTVVGTPLAPTMSSPVNGATGVSTNLALSWNAASGAVSYRLQLSTNSSFSTALIDQDQLTGTSLTVSGLSGSTTYYWRVNATNAGGTSDWSSVWSFTTVVYCGRIRIAWDPPNTDPHSVTGYEVYYGTASKQYGFPISVGNVASHTLTGLMPGQTYFIAAKAYNESYESVYSNEVSAVATIPAQIPRVLYVPAGDNQNPNINQILENHCFEIDQSTGIPSDLSSYQIIILSKNEASNPAAANSIKRFLENGGVAVIMGGTPKLLAGNTEDLAFISDWFGANWYGNDGGYATVLSDYVLWSDLLIGDRVDYSSTNNAASVYDFNPETIATSSWTSYGRTHSFIHSYGAGRIFYYAGDPGYSEDPNPKIKENSLKLFEKGLEWVAAIASPVDAPTLASPFERFADITPTYTWNAVPGSTWYFMWVADSTGTKIAQGYSASEVGCGLGTGLCSVTPAIHLAPGAGIWQIGAWNSIGGLASASMSFAITENAPLLSPSGTIAVTTPTYSWNAVIGSTRYNLSVNDSTGTRIQQWYNASEAGCASGRGICSVPPAIQLAAGDGNWRIQTWINGQEGPWSNPMSFTITSPGAPTLVSPSGAITTTTPTYSWYAVPGGTWYFMWVADSTGTRIAQGYSASELGCGLGAGFCSVTPTIQLAPGAGIWQIGAWNSIGGRASASMSFTVTQPATLVSPSGAITNTTPTYIWNAVPGSTRYYLFVDSTGTKIARWYSASEAGCASGTGSCSVTPSIQLTSGVGYWWILTEINNMEGLWSDPMSFTTTSPGAATMVSPSGAITTTTPTYTWNAVPGATWYFMWVADSTGTRIAQGYSASEVGCGSGTGLCSVTPTIQLAPGEGVWEIGAWNSIGGRANPAINFTVYPN